ncbi:MAG: MFS transporter [Nitriliruptoraceae bacterium]
MTSTDPGPDGEPIPAGPVGAERLAGHPALTSGALLAAVMVTALNLRPAVTSVGALLPEIQAAVGMSAAAAGVLTSLPVVAFGVVAFAANHLARRLGLLPALVLATSAIAVGLALRVAVPRTGWLLATSLLALAGIAIGNVLLPVAVRAWFPDRVGPATGWYAIALSVGTALPAAVAVPIAAVLGGWRPGLGFWALPAAIAVVPWAVAVRRDRARTEVAAARPPPAPSRTTASEAAVPPADVPGRPAPPATSMGAPAPPVGVQPVGVHRRLQSWALAGYLGIQSLEAYVIMGWLPTILREAGVEAATAGAMLGVAMVVGGPVALVIPRLAGRSDDQRVYVAGLALLSLAGYLGLLLAPAAAPLLWTVLLGFGLGAFPLALLLLGLRAATPAGTAALSSLAQGAGYLLAATGPVTIGILRDRTGSWTVPLLVLLTLLLPKLLAGLVAARPGHVDDPAGGR